MWWINVDFQGYPHIKDPFHVALIYGWSTTIKRNKTEYPSSYSSYDAKFQIKWNRSLGSQTIKKKLLSITPQTTSIPKQSVFGFINQKLSKNTQK